MFQIGDEVYIEDAARVDISVLSWLSYIQDHRVARIAGLMSDAEMGVDMQGKPRTPDYAVVWPDEFMGGHDCYGRCEAKRGQFINEKHLSLNFERSREVTTVPNI